RRAWDARVVRTKSMELMRIGSGDQWFVETICDFHGAPIWIEKTAPKMTELNCIKGIDSFDLFPSNRPAENIKWVRRDGEKRFAPAPAQLFQIIQIPKRFDFACASINQNDIGAF